MGPVVVDLSVSLDGFIAGPDDGPGNPLGDGGGRLFDWWTAGTERIGPDDRFKPPARSRAVAREIFDSGAVITGRRTFDIARGWGGHHPLGCPFFLLTRNPPGRWTGPGTGGTVVTDGIESALKQARAVAGDRMIYVCAARTAQQFLNAGLLDEIRLSLVPVVLGGVRLLDNLGGQQLSPAAAGGHPAGRLPGPRCPGQDGAALGEDRPPGGHHGVRWRVLAQHAPPSQSRALLEGSVMGGLAPRATALSATTEIRFSGSFFTRFPEIGTGGADIHVL